MKHPSSNISFLKCNNNHNNGANLESLDIRNFKWYLLAVEKVVCLAVVFIAPKNLTIWKIFRIFQYKRYITTKIRMKARGCKSSKSVFPYIWRRWISLIHFLISVTIKRLIFFKWSCWLASLDFLQINSLLTAIWDAWIPCCFAQMCTDTKTSSHFFIFLKIHYH